MLRVNIVLGAGDRDWIIGRFARELVARLPAHGVSAWINDPALGSDLEFHPVVYGPPSRRPAVGTFTHGEDRPRRYALDYDGHMTFSSTLADVLRECGARAPVILPYPVDETVLLGRPVRFGVAGRVYGDGRKGEHLVRAMLAAGHVVVAWGHGWPRGVLDAGSDPASRRAFYERIDYYIDTSSDEGGCVPAAEAVAMGVPVISHTVGVARPVIPYRRSDADDLLRVVECLTRRYGYDDWAMDHAAEFLRVVETAGVAA